jgi:hypothetical protein
VTMLAARALDVLARTEMQHHAVVEAHTRLERCLTELRLNPPTPAGRRGRLDSIAGFVEEVVAALRVERLLVIEMQLAVSGLRTSEDTIPYWH